MAGRFRQPPSDPDRAVAFEVEEDPIMLPTANPTTSITATRAPTRSPWRRAAQTAMPAITTNAARVPLSWVAAAKAATGRAQVAADVTNRGTMRAKASTHNAAKWTGLPASPAERPPASTRSPLKLFRLTIAASKATATQMRIPRTRNRSSRGRASGRSRRPMAQAPARLAMNKSPVPWL